MRQKIAFLLLVMAMVLSVTQAMAVNFSKEQAQAPPVYMAQVMPAIGGGSSNFAPTVSTTPNQAASPGQSQWSQNVNKQVQKATSVPSWQTIKDSKQAMASGTCESCHQNSGHASGNPGDMGVNSAETRYSGHYDLRRIDGA